MDWKGIPAGYSSLGIASIYWSTVAFEYSNEPWPPSTFASSSPSHSVSRLYVLERDCLSRSIITDNFDDFDNIERGDSLSITLYCFYCFEINPKAGLIVMISETFRWNGREILCSNKRIIWKYCSTGLMLLKFSVYLKFNCSWSKFKVWFKKTQVFS